MTHILPRSFLIRSIGFSAAFLFSMFLALMTVPVASAASATIDTALYTSLTPTITGTTDVSPQIIVIIGNNQKWDLYRGAPVTVVDGKWSHTVTTSLPAGKYTLEVFSLVGKKISPTNILHTSIVISTPKSSDITSRIAEITKKIAELKAKIGSTTAPVPSLPSGGSKCDLNLSRTLSLGSQGSDVTNLQNFLKVQGLFSGEVTGYFGPITQKSIQAFQRLHSIVMDGTPATTGFGLVGARTLVALNKSCTVSSSDSSEVYAKITATDLGNSGEGNLARNVIFTDGTSVAFDTLFPLTKDGKSIVDAKTIGDGDNGMTAASRKAAEGLILRRFNGGVQLVLDAHHGDEDETAPVSEGDDFEYITGKLEIQGGAFVKGSLKENEELGPLDRHTTSTSIPETKGRDSISMEGTSKVAFNFFAGTGSDAFDVKYKPTLVGVVQGASTTNALEELKSLMLLQLQQLKAELSDAQ